MSDNESDVVDYKVRRAVGANALRKIGGIVAEENQADAEKARILNGFVRYGWIVLLGVVLLLVYLAGLI